MSRAYTPEKMALRYQALDSGLFQRRSVGRKIECVVCLRGGYAGGSWMDKHIEGHAPCLACGKQYTIKTINMHWSKTGHVDQRGVL